LANHNHFDIILVSRMLSVWVKTRTWVAKAMKAYRAIGTFRNGRTEQNYSLDVVATDEDEARHLVYSNFGSRHGTPRRFINIDSMSEIEPTNSTEPRVIAHFRDTHDFSAPPVQTEEE
jgi:ribosomal protein L20A (L18A)